METTYLLTSTFILYCIEVNSFVPRISSRHILWAKAMMVLGVLGENINTYILSCWQALPYKQIIWMFFHSQLKQDSKEKVL